MFIVTANSEKELDNLLEKLPDEIILAVNSLSLRQNIFLNPDLAVPIINKIHKKGIRVSINAMKMLDESNIASAEDLVRWCAENKIDGLYIADEGYIPVAQKYHYLDHLIYQPETLITNEMDALFYLQLGFQAVSLAHELSLKEIESISKAVNGLEIQIQGYYSWMYSRRRLLTNYFKQINREIPKKCLNKQKTVNLFKEDNKYEQTDAETSSSLIEKELQNQDQTFSLLIRETGREGLMQVNESDAGTIVYSDEPLCSISQIIQLKEAGIDRFRIDTLFEDDEYGCRQLDLYRKVLEEIPLSKEDLKAKKGTDSGYFLQTTLRKEKQERR